jgi:hypothetical protein
MPQLTSEYMGGAFIIFIFFTKHFFIKKRLAASYSHALPRQCIGLLQICAVFMVFEDFILVVPNTWVVRSIR